jgi:hypothetical protein
MAKGVNKHERDGKRGRAMRSRIACFHGRFSLSVPLQVCITATSRHFMSPCMTGIIASALHNN